MFKTQKLIMEKIDNLNYKIYTSSDFLDIASSETINKCLELLERDGHLKKIKRGYYYKPHLNIVLGIKTTPGLNDFAYTIAKKNNWLIVPRAEYALNIIGLSTQVPRILMFASTGPYKEYAIGNAIISFNHASSKELFDISNNILIAIQAIKAIGKNNISNYDLDKIKDYLSDEDREEIIKGIKVTNWINEVLMEIAKD